MCMEMSDSYIKRLIYMCQEISDSHVKKITDLCISKESDLHMFIKL